MAFGFGFGMRPTIVLPASVDHAWSPRDLGRSLLGYWDAEEAATIHHTGGSVNYWTDRIGDYTAAQSVGGSKPVYSGTSFGGRPGLTFDGIDDNLSMPSIPFPTGSDACEMWALVRQDAAQEDQFNRTVFGYGNLSGASRRALRRVQQLDGINRASCLVGDGSTAKTAIATDGDFSGIHIIRARVTPTSGHISIDGGAEGSIAGVPATSAGGETLIGSLTASAQFYKGVINSILVTSPLTIEQVTPLMAFLKQRGGIA